MEKLLAYLDAERGRRQRLADNLGISPSAISMWTGVPVDRVAQVAEFTGIPVTDLRPDLAAVFAPAPTKTGEAA